MSNPKIVRFESFLNDRLKPDLLRVLRERDHLYEHIADYLALKNTINALNNAHLHPNEPLKTKVDLGCSFFVEAHIRERNRILVDVGQNFLLELEYAEAVAFIDKKVAILEDRAKHLTDKACLIKANIKLTLGGLQELQMGKESLVNKED